MEKDNSITADEQSLIVERRKHYRYAVPQELSDKYSIVFVLPDSSPLKRPIRNMNVEAAAVDVEKGDWRRLSDKKEFEVSIMMGEDLMESCCVSFIRSSPELIVVHFKNLSSKQRELIRNHFPTFLGYSLKKVETNLNLPDSPAVWCHGDNNADLFLWRSKKNTSEFGRCVFTFEDSIIEWNEDGGLKTGRVEHEVYILSMDFRDREEPAKEYDPKPRPDTLNYALKIVETSPMDPASKKFLGEIFKIP